MSYVYLICHTSEEMLFAPCKVGISADPAKRLRFLQHNNPYELMLLDFWERPSREQARKDETRLHQMFVRTHLRGEWFDIEPIEALGLARELVGVPGALEHQHGFPPGIHKAFERAA